MTLDRNAEIVRRMQAGETNAEIGRAFGITGERIRQIGARAGVASTANDPLYQPSPDEAARLVALYERGMPILHIADVLGRGARHVWRWLVRNGHHTPADDYEAWSEAEDARLRQEYGDWGAATRLAKELSRSRNEIIGRAWRLGLSRRTKPQSKRAA